MSVAAAHNGTDDTAKVTHHGTRSHSCAPALCRCTQYIRKLEENLQGILGGSEVQFTHLKCSEEMEKPLHSTAYYNIP